MNKREGHKRRAALTITVTIYIFTIMFITTVISFVGVKALLKMGVIDTLSAGNTDPQYALLVMLFISLVVGLFVTSLTSHMFLKYVDNYLDQMNRLATGDFKARLEYGAFISKHPTMNEIAASFNTMAEELENTKMLRGDFINNFSHEFKTPIVSISGFAKLLKHGNLTEKQKTEYLDVIEEESLRLSAMATNVLNMTKVENQTILTDVTTYNLSEQIRNSVLLLENAWTKKNIEFDLAFEEHKIEANEELLKQVWINLLDNAIKYSSEYGIITIRIIALQDEVEISVENAGDEIPIQCRKKIFDKFYQADESHSSVGNGIGLAIVKKVVELHSGNVGVECKNGLTTFSVRIPK